MWKAEHRAASDRGGLRYSGDLTDVEWALLAPMIPPAKHGGRLPVEGAAQGPTAQEHGP